LFQVFLDSDIMVKAIFFDLQGVLTEHGRMFSENLPDAWEPEVEREEAIRRYYKFRTLPEIDKKEFFKGVPENKKEVFLELSKIHDGAKEVVVELSKSYPLYVASNHIDYIFEKEIEQIGLGDYFKEKIVSKNIGVAKPDKEFYESMLSIANVEASEAIFIDDTKTNLEGAKKLGIKTIWLKNNDDNPRNQIDFKADFEISDLREMIDIIKKLEI
jgi:HAD superfamily hydrolase (TIGR01509 family)